jgi:hypothetical protein
VSRYQRGGLDHRYHHDHCRHGGFDCDCCRLRSASHHCFCCCSGYSNCCYSGCSNRYCCSDWWNYYCCSGYSNYYCCSGYSNRYSGYSNHCCCSRHHRLADLEPARSTLLSPREAMKLPVQACPACGLWSVFSCCLLMCAVPPGAHRNRRVANLSVSIRHPTLKEH